MDSYQNKNKAHHFTVDPEVFKKMVYEVKIDVGNIVYDEDCELCNSLKLKLK